jgi:aryl-alcohol dehydrogenase-like predicted oxidoreductase
MAELTRRDFLTGLAAAGTLAIAAPRIWAEEKPAKKRKGSDVVKLGRTGIETTLLGVGSGTNSGNQQRGMGQEGFTRLVRHALDRGIRYVDTADSYRMHAFVQKALEGVPRDRYFIQTKSFARKADAVKLDLERFLRELKVEYVDTFLMHCMTQGDWPKTLEPVMKVLSEAKREGRVRAVGISCHGWEPMEASIDVDWIDVQLARINPFGAVMDAEPEKVSAMLKKVHDKGRGILGMKIFGETGFGSRRKRLESLKYVLGLGSVDAFTIGFRSIAEFDETMDLIEEATA